MIDLEGYLRLGFLKGGRARPAVDCWGLYRLIVGEARGIWLSEFDGHEEPLRIARTASREASGNSWLPVAPGEERPLDAVLMTGLLGEGRGSISGRPSREGARGSLIAAPIHVGCVIGPGRLIDIEETGGVRVRSFRTTATLRAAPEVANRVRGIFRPRALA